MTRRAEELASRELGRLPNEAANNPGEKNGNGGNECNSQICSSFVVGLLACLLIVGGIFLAFQRWDYTWLVVSVIGIVLTFVGASLHYCGTKEESARRSGGIGNPNPGREASQSERLLSPSAPSLGAFSSSQLSLSTLPPYFPSYDAVSLSNGALFANPSIVGSSGAISPIMRINGQSFLLLPIGGRINEDGTIQGGDVQSRVSVDKMAPDSGPQRLNGDLNRVADERQRSNDESTTNATPASSPSVSQSTQTRTVSVEIQTVPEVPRNALQTEVVPNNEAVPIDNGYEPIYEVPRLVLERVGDALEEVSVMEDIDRQSVAPTETPITELSVPIAVDSQSRATTPDRDESEDTASPPSYEEVAVTTLRQGMPKLAYETM